MILDLDDKFQLRRPEPKDVEALYCYRNDPKIVSALGDYSRGFSRADLVEWVEYHRKNHQDLVWIITDQRDCCIGHCGLYQIDFRVGVAEYGICIGMSENRGQGLGELISKAIISYAFDQLNLRRLRLEVLATNLPAINLYQKIGFEKEGVLREEQFRDGVYVDIYLFGLLKSDLKPKSAI